MLKLKPSERELLENLFKTELGKACLSSFKEIVLREDVQPANALDGYTYAILLASKQAELDVLKQFIKIGERNGRK